MTAERPILFSGPMVRAILEDRKAETRRIVRPQPSNAVTSGGVISSGTESDGLWWWLTGDPRDAETWMSDGAPFRCPYGVPGDLLWVRETWARIEPNPSIGEDYLLPDPGLLNADARGSRYLIEFWRRRIVYRADLGDAAGPPAQSDDRWRPSIHMPKWASRLWLRVEDVRVERLQEISEEDAGKEGARRFGEIPEGPLSRQFAHLRWHNANRWSMKEPASTDQCLSTARMAFANAWNEINGKRAPWDSNPWVWAITFSRTEAP